MSSINYAFFDVDETLIRCKSMFEFYRFWLNLNENSSDCYSEFTYREFVERMRGMSRTMERQDINREYFKLYQGVSDAEMTEAGVQWWNSIKNNTNELFHCKVLNRLNELKINDFEIVLVSGSSKYILNPLQQELKIRYGIYTRTEVQGGILTGNVLGSPNIGVHKKNNILKFIEMQNDEVVLENCYAFGDHESDLPMLSLVGNGFLVVDGEPMLQKKLSSEDKIKCV